MPLTNPEKCRRYYEKHRDERCAYQRRYYLENAEKIKASNAEYASKNADHLREIARATRAENIEEIRKRDRERASVRNATPERKAYMHEYVLAHREGITRRAGERLAELRVSFGNKCAKCGYSKVPWILEFDHKIPLADLGLSAGRRRSGKNIARIAIDRELYELLCPNCHAIKTNRWKRAGRAGKPLAVVRKYERRERQRLALIATFGGRCEMCEYGESLDALEFDHKIPLAITGERRQPAFIAARNAPEKFSLVCANCHEIKTREDRKMISAARMAKAM